MAFRNCSFNPSFESPQCVFEDVIKEDVVDGVVISTLVTVKSSDLSSSLPSYSDYKLSALLASGVPLTPVNPVIFNNPLVEVENVVTNLPSQESTDFDADIPSEELAE